MNFDFAIQCIQVGAHDIQANAGRTMMLQTWYRLENPSDEAAWWVRKAASDLSKAYAAIESGLTPDTKLARQLAEPL